MRFHELLEARAWRHYTPFAEQRCKITDIRSATFAEVLVRCGTCSTGKQRVFAGYYFKTQLPAGDLILAENPHGLRRALRTFEARLNGFGWTLDAIGLDAEWRESGLTADSGFGYCAGVLGAVHMLHPRHHPLTDPRSL